jgi:predicted PurR-regulated permease PerM
VTRHVIARAFAVCLVASAALIAWHLREVLMIVLGAVLISSAITPIARRISGRGLRPRAALGLVYAGLLAVVASVGALVGRALVSEVASLGEALGQGYDTWRKHAQAGSFVTRLLTDKLPAQLGEAPSAFFSGATLGSTTAPLHVLTSVAWTIALAICWSYAGQRIEQVGFALLARSWRARARSGWSSLCSTAGDVLRGEAAQSLLLLVSLSGVFVLAHVRYAVVAALLVAALRLLPFIGAPAAVLVGALAGLGVGPWHAVLAAACTALLLIGVARFARIRGYGDVHPLLVAFVALATLIDRGGIAVVLAPVFAAALQGFVEGWLRSAGGAPPGDAAALAAWARPVGPAAASAPGGSG